MAARDNVLFELGLFMGHLGPSRTFIVCSEAAQMKMPSDLAGVVIAKYRPRSDNNLIAAVSPACTQIRLAIRNLGKFGGKGVIKQSQGYETDISENAIERVDKIKKFEDDFHSLHNWETPSGWMPEHSSLGLQLIDHKELSNVLLLKNLPNLPLFCNGMIECEVNLEQDAIFNIMLRGDVTGEFYMTRFDTRPPQPGGILFKPKARDRWWSMLNSGPSVHTSPSNKWLTMRVVADESRISLYSGDELITENNNAKVVPGRIGLFAELKNVYVRKIRIEYSE